MSAFIHAANLSATEVVKKIEAEFALVGYARFIKTLELVAGQGSESGTLTLSWSAWEAALAGDQESLAEFFAFCANAGAFEMEDAGDTVVIRCPTLERPASGITSPATDSTLFTEPAQWAEWFIEDLSWPPAMANDPNNLRLFRHWCASNVTVGDMCAAIQVAIKENTGMSAGALHKQLRALRQRRIEEANKW